MNKLNNLISSDSEDGNFEFEDSLIIQKCQQLLIKLNKEYKENKNEIKNIIKLNQQETKKRTKQKKRTTKSGFNIPEVIPDKLAKLIGLPLGTKLSRSEVTKLIYKVFQDRNLRYELDKRVLRVDDELMKIFNLTKSVNNSIDPKAEKGVGINFYNLQKYIKDLYIDKSIKNTQIRITN